MESICVTAEFVKGIIPKRDAFGHKGDYGKIYVLAGSRGFTGAPTFAAKAAVRAGAGLVYLGVPECIYEIEAQKNDEVMVSPLDCLEDGMLSDAAFVPALSRAITCDVAVIGPGLGRSADTGAVVRGMLKSLDRPVVLDADGLFAVSDNHRVLSERNALTMLTPHEGEMERLGYGGTRENRAERAASAARELGAVVVLKGHETVTACPDGKIFVNTTGNSGMAKGGSGDVLSGIIAALLGQHIAPEEAVAAAVWIHGAAGDIAAEKYGEYSMTPTDLLNCIADVMKNY